MNDYLLNKVEKPARYIGNEINIIKKDVEKIDIRFALAFPDVYEVGMSHLGMEILYYFLNERSDTYAERVYTPWIDMEELMRKANIPLFALETQDDLNKFDFIGFTLQYEMSYTNILTMLDLSNIPFLSNDRMEEHPIIIAGGPCAYNPEPMADIIDVFYIGEGEELLNDIMDAYKDSITKEDFYRKIIDFEGIYIPRYYQCTYNEDNTIKDFSSNIAPNKITKVITKNLNDVYYPKKQLVPLTEIVHDRVTLEVFRGCTRGCRFCQAGYVYRPVREKMPSTLIEQGVELVNNSGHEEISLVSLSTGDYSKFSEVANGLLDKFEDCKVNLSLPSLRVDGFTINIMERIQSVRKSSITFAPEAGSQRMRDVINKGITEEEIINGCKLCFEGGWNKLKLYFMIGLPTETIEDILDIGELGYKIIDLNRGKAKINISTSCFVPKPFTPFQWMKQNSYDEFMFKQKELKAHIKSKAIRYTYHDAKLSVLEGVFARGDRRLSNVIIKAYEKGARYDGWTEHFKYNTWVEAFEECGIDMDFYTRERCKDEILPWDFIDIGVTKNFLIDEEKKSVESKITPNCKVKCSYCGAQKFKGGICIDKI
ncbi:MAG: TIGR03960 family B12-binding radical SAM protein [Lachnospirales bacterium]